MIPSLRKTPGMEKGAFEKKCIECLLIERIERKREMIG